MTDRQTHTHTHTQKGASIGRGGEWPILISKVGKRTVTESRRIRVGKGLS
jgi:hypothetical protein